MRYSSTFCALLLLASSIAFSESFFVWLPTDDQRTNTKTVDMSLDDDVETLCEHLSSIANLPRKLFYLTFNGRVLDPRKNLSLREYGLKSQDTIFANVKSLCCLRCSPITAMQHLFSTIVHCITTAFFIDDRVEEGDLCACTDLATDED